MLKAMLCAFYHPCSNLCCKLLSFDLNTVDAGVNSLLPGGGGGGGGFGANQGEN